MWSFVIHTAPITAKLLFVHLVFLGNLQNDFLHALCGDDHLSVAFLAANVLRFVCLIFSNAYSTAYRYYSCGDGHLSVAFARHV